MQTLQILIPRLRKALAQLPYIPQTLSLVWSAARGWTVTWGVLLLLQGLLPVAGVYVTRWLVNSLVAAIRAGGSWDLLRPTLLLVLLMGE
jgi:ATP-binding cassette subfamily B protein